MNTNRVPCPKCGTPALPETLQTHDGICVHCAKRRHSPYGLSRELAARAVPVPKGEEARLIRQSHISALHPSLQPLLAKELSVGNAVVETTMDWPQQGSIFIMLAFPFKASVSELPDQVIYRELNDPHYWKAEYLHSEVKHVLACRFAA
jgi:hypothetical protein